MGVINKQGLNGQDNYLGFTFNGQHSSNFKIIRISNSDRYYDNIISTPEDKTLTIPGVDGQILVQSQFKSKDFSIDFAFNYLKEEDIENIKKWLAKNTLGELWFDENPYKAYYAKISSTLKLSYLSFDEGDERIYKGDGTVSFIAYDPKAHARSKTYDDTSVYGENGLYVQNRSEWQAASGMFRTKDYVSKKCDFIDSGESMAFVYNPGNYDSPWWFIFKKVNFSDQDGIQKIFYTETENDITYVKKQFYLDVNSLKTTENSNTIFYGINSNTKVFGQLLETTQTGVFPATEKCPSFSKSLNNLVIAGEIFDIPYLSNKNIAQHINFDPPLGTYINRAVSSSPNINYTYYY